MPDDQIKRFVEHGVEELPVSPMDPPEAYQPPAAESLTYEQLVAPLRELWDEHENYLKVLSVFENAMIALKDNKWKMTPEISSAFRDYFQFVDEHVTVHNRKEERGLFPVLRERLIQKGECSPGEAPVTPADIMEDEHAKVGQSVAIVFTLLGLAPRLQDAASRDQLFEQAFQLGQEIVETMKLHIFRENTILFPMAQQILNEEEWIEIATKMKRC